MKKIAAKLTRSGMANVLGVAGGSSLVVGAWSWHPLAGLVALGAGLMVAGWAVDE